MMLTSLLPAIFQLWVCLKAVAAIHSKGMAEGRAFAELDSSFTF